MLILASIIRPLLMAKRTSLPVITRWMRRREIRLATALVSQHVLIHGIINPSRAVSAPSTLVRLQWKEQDSYPLKKRLPNPLPTTFIHHLMLIRVVNAICPLIYLLVYNPNRSHNHKRHHPARQRPRPRPRPTLWTRISNLSNNFVSMRICILLRHHSVSQLLKKVKRSPHGIQTRRSHRRVHPCPIYINSIPDMCSRARLHNLRQMMIMSIVG